MSYIHDALRKAQREKDAGYRYYEPALPSGKGGVHKGTLRSRVVMGTLLSVLLFAFLSLLGYNFLTGGEKRAIYSKETALASGNGSVAPQAMKAENPESSHPPPALEELCQEALGRQRRGDSAGAERVYEKILARDAGCVFALNNLGVIRLHQGRGETARVLFEEAIRIDGSYVDPLYNMACLHARSGNSAAALESLRKAWRLDVKILEWAEGDADLAALCESPEYKNTFYAHGEDGAQ